MTRSAPAIGITGGTGVGKSTVTHAFERRGALEQRRALILDGDRVGHEILDDATVRETLSEAFGTEIVGANGRIDRRVLGAKVFSDPDALARLNAIVHPPLLGQLRERLDNATGVSLVVVDAALITEWGIEDWFDRVVVVTASAEAVAERLRAKGLTDKQVANRIASQLSVAERIRRATQRGNSPPVVIENDGDIAQIERAVAKLWKEMVR